MNKHQSVNNDISITYGQVNGRGRREHDNIHKLKMLVTAGNKQICSDIARTNLNFCHTNDNQKKLGNLPFFFGGVGGGGGLVQGQGIRQDTQYRQYDQYYKFQLYVSRISRDKHAFCCYHC